MTTDTTFLYDLDLTKWPPEPFRLPFAFRKKSIAPKEILAKVYESRDSQHLAELILTDQGTRLDEAPLAIPFLGRLIPLLDDVGKLKIVNDLVLLGVGFEEECLGFRGVQKCSAFHAQCYDLVSKEAWRFVELLMSSNQRLEDAACRAVAWFSKDVEVALSMLVKKVGSVALVSRALLGDSSIEIAQDSLKSRFTSNAAFCYGERADSSNLEIFLEMSQGSRNMDMSLAPFEFCLNWFSAEAIHRQEPKFVETCLSKFPDGPLKNCVSTPQPWRKTYRS